MSEQAAARATDQIAHGFGVASMIAGVVAGALIGAAVVAATAATGGAAAVIIAGAVAAGGLSTFQVVKGLTTIFNLPEPTTGVLVPGSLNVFVNSLAAMRAGVDLAAGCSGLPCNHFPLPTTLIAEGSATVYVNSMPMARLTSKMVCGGHIKSASQNTFVGGPTKRVAFVYDLESWLHTGLEVLGIAALAGGLVLAAAAGAAALGAFVVTGAAIYGGMQILGDIGNQLGPGYADLLQGVAGFALLGLGAKVADEEPVVPGDDDPVVPSDEPPPEDPAEPAAPQDPPGSYRDANGRLHDSDGKFISDPNAPPRAISRDTEYPSSYRQSTHDEMAAQWTDEGQAQGGTPVDANGDKIPRDQLTWRDGDGNEVPYYDENGNTNLTYDHDPPVVQHWNEEGGNDMSRADRNDYYNDPDNLTPMGRSQNSSDGASLGMTYDQTTGPNYSR